MKGILPTLVFQRNKLVMGSSFLCKNPLMEHLEILDCWRKLFLHNCFIQVIRGFNKAGNIFHKVPNNFFPFLNCCCTFASFLKLAYFWYHLTWWKIILFKNFKGFSQIEFLLLTLSDKLMTLGRILLTGEWWLNRYLGQINHGWCIYNQLHLYFWFLEWFWGNNSILTLLISLSVTIVMTCSEIVYRSYYK